MYIRMRMERIRRVNVATVKSPGVSCMLHTELQALTVFLIRSDLSQLDKCSESVVIRIPTKVFCCVQHLVCAPPGALYQVHSAEGFAPWCFIIIMY